MAVVMMLSQVVVVGWVSRLIIRQRAVTVSASETESQRREGWGVLQLLDWTRWKMVPSITCSQGTLSDNHSDIYSYYNRSVV